MTTLSAERVRRGRGTLSIRDVSLFAEVIGEGAPLLLMHGGPGAGSLVDVAVPPTRGSVHAGLLRPSLQRTIARRSGPSMTWDNLTADADALRERLGFERWAVLGHSFGGHVALEYSLRYPDSVSHLVLLDTGGREPMVAAARGRGARGSRIQPEEGGSARGGGSTGRFRTGSSCSPRCDSATPTTRTRRSWITRARSLPSGTRRCGPRR